MIGTTLEEANLGFGAEAFAAFDAHDAVTELATTYPDASPHLCEDTASDDTGAEYLPKTSTT